MYKIKLVNFQLKQISIVKNVKKWKEKYHHLNKRLLKKIY